MRRAPWPRLFQTALRHCENLGSIPHPSQTRGAASIQQRAALKARLSRRAEFGSSGRPDLSNAPLAYPTQISNSSSRRLQLSGCFRKGNCIWYRMAQVNSRGESRPSERRLRRALALRGQQPTAESGGFRGLQRGGRRTERMLPKGTLAEERDSNCRYRSCEPLRRGLLDHGHAWPHAQGSRTCLSAIPAPRWPSRVARLRPDPKPELEIRLSATSTHILAGHAVPPSSGRGRRAAWRQLSRSTSVAGSY
jgi:hypothetical protein